MRGSFYFYLFQYFNNGRILIILDISFVDNLAKIVYLWLVCGAIVCDLNWVLRLRVCDLDWLIAIVCTISFGRSWKVFVEWFCSRRFVLFSILRRSFNLILVCCFLLFKKLKVPSTAIFDSSINILVVLWFKSTWTILKIKDCTPAKCSAIATGSIHA